MVFNLKVFKYPKEGFLQNTYSALRNYKTEGGNIGSFQIDASKLNVDVSNISMICQPSYDGSVNLILNDDKNPPRIINTRFSKKEDNQFKIIDRNQTKQTNVYEDSFLDQQTRLVKNTNVFPKVDLLDVAHNGQLKGGNYTIYVKYIDVDFNESAIVCESGQISIFHGVFPVECSGTLEDESTSKSMQLRLSNLDQSYNAVKLYLVRNYSNTSGARLQEAFSINEPYKILGRSIDITITGFESIKNIPIDELNIAYQSISAAKTQTQVQNMLFLGNIEKSISDYNKLQQLAYCIKVTLSQNKDGIGCVGQDYDYYKDMEYYNPANIYYKLGYWPGEYYKMGVVFIMNDDSTTPVFNLKGCVFNEIGDSNDAKYEKDLPTFEFNEYISHESRKYNTFGTFKLPSEKNDNRIIQTNDVKPWYFQMEISDQLQEELKKLKIKGYFFVRQKRIPTILAQGVSIGIDKTSYAPMIPFDNKYWAESFLKKEDNLVVLKSKYDDDLISINTNEKQSSGIISVDVNTSSITQSMLDGSSFCFESVPSRAIVQQGRNFSLIGAVNDLKQNEYTRAVYIPEGTQYKFIGDYGFSTQFGIAEDIKQLSFIGKSITNSKYDEHEKGETNDQPIYDSDKVYGGKNINILRGYYTGIIGLCGNLTDGRLYNIRIPEYSDRKVENYLDIRKNDNSEYYAISNRYLINNEPTTIDVYRGDCYTNTVTVRLNRNFSDPEAPIQDTIVDKKTWAKNYLGYLKMGSGLTEKSEAKYETDKNVSGDWMQINRSDVNAVPLGTWLTYKCLSSNNLGIRCIDRSYPDEEALYGNPRSFYPLNGKSLQSSNKIPESNLINLGYGSTVGVNPYFPNKNLPYVKELFDNRIMFSNVAVNDDFSNGYRVFQNMAYKDIDRQYGAIVKLLPWDTDLLCVFEHGIGIIPVNEKALIQTTIDQSIHMYGAGVLSSQISLVTGVYGSVWSESIISTPIGVYGIDTISKKIWRVSKHKGFETISDMTIQRFLNDNILFKENEFYPKIGLYNVKTHYNDNKGDVIFTFYNNREKKEWSLCYNERLGKWTTRYSWIPLYSENINNSYFSFDKHRVEILSKFAQLQSDSYGLKSDNIEDLQYDIEQNGRKSISFKLLSTFSNKTTFEMTINGAKTSYLTDDKKEVFVDFSKDDVDNFIEVNENIITIDYFNFKNNWGWKFTKKESTRTFTYFSVDLGDLVSHPDHEGTFSNEWTEDEIKEIIKEVDDWKEVNPELDERGEYWGFYEEVEKDIQNPPTPLPLWLQIDISVKYAYENHDLPVSNNYEIVLLCKRPSKESALDMWKQMFTNGVFVHGRSGVFDSIDYTDNSLDNQILPTRWYGKQEPFEFEFVVNDPIGIHKVFENLTIISNNAEPESIQFEIEGDAYSFWKTKGVWEKDKKKSQYENNELFKNASIKWDSVLNNYSILLNQECKSIEKFGRIRGNMQYKEDSWYININPILLSKNNKTVSTKLRDKYLKVRVRYSGEDLAIITAIKTMVNLSSS